MVVQMRMLTIRILEEMKETGLKEKAERITLMDTSHYKSEEVSYLTEPLMRS